MATAVANLTTTPIVVAVEVDRELSGAHWCARFPGDNRLKALDPTFKPSVDTFFSALDASGARYIVSAVYRPKERAYLMHWSYKIAKGTISPDKVPSHDGILIEWVHPTAAASIAAAKSMCDTYRTFHLGTEPALHSQHEVRLAVDVSISWVGTLTIQNKDGKEIKITSEPRTGMNRDLIAAGATYGVIKYNRTGTDKPHWSSTGA